MKIGIVTYVKCDNYGAELQAFAMQYVYNKLGYDAEVLDLEKQNKDISSSLSTIIPAIVNRFKTYGINAPYKILQLVWDVIQRKKAKKSFAAEIQKKHELYTKFFNEKIKHSSKYYTLKNVYMEDMSYDVYVAGSDQIWNYMHTDYLDVYFLEFANRFKAKKIAYAASLSVPDLPARLHADYKRYFENMDSIAVRELNGKDIVEKYSNKKATVVLDPTLLVRKQVKAKIKSDFNDEKYVNEFQRWMTLRSSILIIQQLLLGVLPIKMKIRLCGFSLLCLPHFFTLTFFKYVRFKINNHWKDFK